MIARRVAAMMMMMLLLLLLLIPASEYAANPFLNTSDDKPVSAEFREANGAMKLIRNKYHLAHGPAQRA